MDQKGPLVSLTTQHEPMLGCAMPHASLEAVLPPHIPPQKDNDDIGLFAKLFPR